MLNAKKRAASAVDSGKSAIHLTLRVRFGAGETVKIIRLRKPDNTLVGTAYGRATQAVNGVATAQLNATNQSGTSFLLEVRVGTQTTVCYVNFGDRPRYARQLYATADIAEDNRCAVAVTGWTL